MLFTSCKATRGDLPIGVFYNKKSGRFSAHIRRFGVLNTIGLYDTPEEAFVVYKIAKESHVKSMALQYKDVLRPDVFDALMVWQVDIFS